MRPEYRRIARPELPDLRWYKQPVHEYHGRIDDLRHVLPTFERRPLATGPRPNEYLDLIVRLPLTAREGEVPVGTVSKTYSLIQHTELLDVLGTAWQQTGVDADFANCTLLMSEYGERIHLRATLPSYAFDPGDGNVIDLALECINSVEGSTALIIFFGWWRLVCTNGMKSLVGVELKWKHTGGLTVERVAQELIEGLKRVKAERQILAGWMRARVTWPKLIGWADEDISKVWGVHSAARLCHIASTGYDGAVTPSPRKLAPHEMEVSDSVSVPGMRTPIENAFYCSQALSWLASHAPSVEMRIERMAQVHPLMTKLLG